MNGVGTGFTPEKRKAFLDELEVNPNVSAACLRAGVSRHCAYDERGRDPEFRREWEKAKKKGFEAAEDEAWRRATEGVEEPVFYQGIECGAIRKYSDTLLIFMLKGNKPKKYRERTEISGDPKRPLRVKVSADEMSDEELAEIAAGKDDSK